MDALPPTLPFALSKAYGPGNGPMRAVGPSGPTASTASIDAAAAPARGPSFVDRLAAAVVPGRVSFDGPVPAPAPATGALPFYRRPGDQNAAATAVAVGRTLDVQG